MQFLHYKHRACLLGLFVLFIMSIAQAEPKLVQTGVCSWVKEEEAKGEKIREVEPIPVVAWGIYETWEKTPGPKGGSKLVSSSVKWASQVSADSSEVVLKDDVISNEKFFEGEKQEGPPKLNKMQFKGKVRHHREACMRKATWTLELSKKVKLTMLAGKSILVQDGTLSRTNNLLQTISKPVLCSINADFTAGNPTFILPFMPPKPAFIEPKVTEDEVCSEEDEQMPRTQVTCYPPSYGKGQSKIPPLQWSYSGKSKEEIMKKLQISIVNASEGKGQVNTVDVENNIPILIQGRVYLSPSEAKIFIIKSLKPQDPFNGNWTFNGFLGDTDLSNIEFGNCMVEGIPVVSKAEKEGKS